MTRILITDEEGNFLYMNIQATDAELDFILAAINARSNCTAEVVPALLERSV